MNGEPAAILAALPFQINAQIPADIPTGIAAIAVASANGNASASAAISDVAPEIFSLTGTQAAIVNQDNTLNTPSNPASRGAYIVIYGTGFGATGSSGTLSPVKTALSVVIGGAALVPAFAGLTPGSVGLYQVNLQLPSAIPPGLALPLYLKQGNATGAAVTVAVQ